MRILRQQGFAVQTFTAEHEVTPAALLQLLTDKAAELDCAFIATGHYARIEVDGEGLSHLLPAADAKDELQDSFVRYWTEQVMLLKKTGDDFKDTQGGYRFLAYRRDGDVFPELVCVLYLS